MRINRTRGVPSIRLMTERDNLVKIEALFFFSLRQSKKIVLFSIAKASKVAK